MQHAVVRLRQKTTQNATALCRASVTAILHATASKISARTQNADISFFLMRVGLEPESRNSWPTITEIG